MPPTSFQPRKILVTGSTGFVGQYLRAALAARWPDADIVGLGVETRRGSLVANIVDRAAVDAAVALAQPDVIVHLAAQASVAQGAWDQAATWAVNVGGTLNLALAVAAHARDALVLFASSSEVYGGSFRDGPVGEETPLQPTNAYARSKALAERVLADVLAPETRLIVARPFNHTGPGQREEFALPSFVGQVARIEAGLQPPFLSAGNIDVSRDFLDVRDVAQAYIALISQAPQLPPRFTCNIASEQIAPLRQHIETLLNMSKRTFEIIIDADRVRPIDLPSASGRASLLRNTTSWTPHWDMRDTLANMLSEARLKIANHK